MILVGALQTPNFPTCCICGCRDKSKLIGFELSHEILTSKHRFNLCKNHAMELADDIDELVKRKYKESKHEEIRSGKKQNNLLARWKNESKTLQGQDLEI